MKQSTAFIIVIPRRAAGAVTTGPKPFAPRDRSNFLSALERALVRLKRDGFG